MRSMDIEERLSDQQLFARWADEDLASWERAVGMSLTHLSRGAGRIGAVSSAGGVIAVQVDYARSHYVHATWELRTEFTGMTLPAGITRADLIPGARARRLRLATAARDERALLPSRWRGYGGDGP